MAKKKRKPKPKFVKNKSGVWVQLGGKKTVSCIACMDTGKNSKGRNCICVDKRGLLK